MQKWEYLSLMTDEYGRADSIYPAVYDNYLPFGKNLPLGKKLLIYDVFTRLGAEGWELVATYRGQYFFKRPIET